MADTASPCMNCKHKDKLTVQEPCWSCISTEALVLPLYGKSTYTHFEPDTEKKEGAE